MKKVSYSQFSLYHQCPNRWKLDYIDGLRTHEQSIHTIFGSAIHEAIQHWLQVVYNESVKAGDAVDFRTMLKESLMSKYKQSITEGQSHYSTPQELTEFYNDGMLILDYIRKKRTSYFTTKLFLDFILAPHFRNFDCFLIRKHRNSVGFMHCGDSDYFCARINFRRSFCGTVFTGT